MIQSPLDTRDFNITDSTNSISFSLRHKQFGPMVSVHSLLRQLNVPPIGSGADFVQCFGIISGSAITTRVSKDLDSTMAPLLSSRTVDSIFPTVLEEQKASENWEDVAIWMGPNSRLSGELRLISVSSVVLTERRTVEHGCRGV